MPEPSMMNPWLQFADRYGFTTVFCLLLIFFWYRSVWPFLIDQMKYYQAALDTTKAEFATASREFLSALERRDRALDLRDREFTEIRDGLENVVSELRLLRDEVVRNGANARADSKG